MMRGMGDNIVRMYRVVILATIAVTFVVGVAIGYLIGRSV